MTEAASSKSTGPHRLVIRNIGLLLSGDHERPILDADTVVAADGRIVSVGREKDVDVGNAATVIDARGTALSPGLIDSHVHPVAGDWTPRQNQLGWIDSYMHGGVTTMISAGEVHTPGLPKDVVGLKAMAICAQRSFNAFRPGGVKIHAGAPVIEHGMVEDDFKELAALLTLRTAKELNQLGRVILGTDSPAGSGVQPLGILRMISLLSSLGDVPAEVAICFATGNTAKIRNLDCGLIAPGKAANFVLMDKAQHSSGKDLLASIQRGDLPGIGMVIIDGVVSAQRSRNTPPATRVPEVITR